MTQQTEQLIKYDLDQFTGTENYYKHWTGALMYTDGVKFLSDRGGAHWLIDLIAGYRRKEPFQIWKFERVNKGAVVTMRENTDQPELVRQEIGYSDFPFDEFELWLIDCILILKSEY